MFANLGAWWWMNRPHIDLPWYGEIESISFSPFRADDDPFAGRFPPESSIDSDLALLSKKVGAVRIYTALQGNDVVPELAAKYGLKVIAGAYIKGNLNDPNLLLSVPPDKMNGDQKKAYDTQMEDLTSDQEEIDAVVKMAREHDNVTRVIVGNEAIYTGQATIGQMIGYINAVKRDITQPVSTAEPAYVWLSHPELVNAVDFIAIHVLPYWEGVPADHAVDFVLGQIDAVSRVYPGKHVMLAEIGWPSAGKPRGDADPSLVNQAMVLRRFLNVAEERKLDYNVIEAFDQPWKKEIEWSVGTHWGLWDADRDPKFSMVKPVIEVKEWPAQASAASFLALIPVAWFLYNWRGLRTRGKMFFAVLIQFVASLLIWAISVPILRDFAPSVELLFSVLVPALLLLVVVVLVAGYELTELTWAGQLRRRFTPDMAPVPARIRKVSLHVPCYNEPPEMMVETLNALAALDYPDFEVLVLDNNTRDPEVWKPVLDHCRKLGERFKFYHLGKWPGAKAGALNFALTQTDPAAEVIGVVDADYLANPDWLKSLVPFFENPRIGWVQSPQDHREWEDDLFKECINWEYAGFFEIGMIARNEDNAIIQHGTMTLINRAALEEVGNWGEWCIVEDAETGLKMLEAGYESIYIDHRFGYGLTPDNFTAYRKQRFRWAYGSVQILKSHWRSLLPFRKSGLTAAQKYHYVSGWLPWTADAFYVLFTVLSVVWTAGLILAPQSFDFPLAIFVMPTVGVFVAKLLHHLFLYSTRVKCNWRQRFGSAIAGMGLTFTIGRAMWWGLLTRSVPFLRTPKMEGKAAWTAGFLMAREEAVLMLLQWISAGAILFDKGWNDIDARMWALVMVVQSIPFAAALATGIISATSTTGLMKRLNKGRAAASDLLPSQT